MKYCEITTNLSECSHEQLVSALGSLLTAMQDEAYAYDLQTEFAERAHEALQECDVPCQITDEEDYDV